MKSAMLNTLRHYLKSLKEKWNLWAMGLDNSSGPANNAPMDCGLDSIRRFSLARNRSTLIKFTFEPNTTTTLRILILLPSREIYFSTTNKLISVKSTADGTSRELL